MHSFHSSTDLHHPVITQSRAADSDEQACRIPSGNTGGKHNERVQNENKVACTFWSSFVNLVLGSQKLRLKGVKKLI